MKWTRLENESDEHLLMRLAFHKDEIGTWDDIADIMNELTGESHTESCYRRRYKSQYGDMETSELAQLLGAVIFFILVAVISVIQNKITTRKEVEQ